MPRAHFLDAFGRHVGSQGEPLAFIVRLVGTCVFLTLVCYVLGVDFKMDMDPNTSDVVRDVLQILSFHGGRRNMSMFPHMLPQ